MWGTQRETKGFIEKPDRLELQTTPERDAEGTLEGDSHRDAALPLGQLLAFEVVFPSWWTTCWNRAVQPFANQLVERKLSPCDSDQARVSKLSGDWTAGTQGSQGQGRSDLGRGHSDAGVITQHLLSTCCVLSTEFSLGAVNINPNLVPA